MATLCLQTVWCRRICRPICWVFLLQQRGYIFLCTCTSCEKNGWKEGEYGEGTSRLRPSTGI